MNWGIERRMKLGWISDRLSLPHHHTLGVLRLMQQMKHVFQSRASLAALSKS